MRDPRLKQLADNILDYSLAIKPGQKLLIESDFTARDLVIALIEGAYSREAVPYYQIGDARIRRAWYMKADRAQLDRSVAWSLARMDEMDAILAIYGGENDSEMVDVPPEVLESSRMAGEPLLKLELTKRWAVLRYPTPSGAQLAGMSTQAFEDFCLEVSTLDYARMDEAMLPLVKLMERTDRVHVVSPGTDLTFSIKGIAVQKAAGTENIPDGEVFTAPVKDSMNGTIAFNSPSLEEGTTYEGIRFTFKDGKIVDAHSTEQQKLLKILDTDEGSRYIGEFALGLNPLITRPMKDTLYDEKIAGSMHLAVGRAYDDADNGNHSSVHWDLVLIQTPEWGGGQIYFDDVLVRDDGRFVLPELQGLNPENLA